MNTMIEGTLTVEPIANSLVQILFNFEKQDHLIIYGHLYHDMKCGAGNSESLKGASMLDSIIAPRELYNTVRAMPKYGTSLPELVTVKVYIQWGEEEAREAHENGINKETATLYEFENTIQAHCFLKGIDQADGWNGYCSHIEP